MATYTDPIEKSWEMDSYDDFAEGTLNGAEIENPNYPGKIVLECLLGTNKLGPTEKDWNPSFETPHVIEDRPNHWRFEFPSTGSTYVQEAEEPFEGDDHVNLADDEPGGGERFSVGRLILDPEDPGIGPENLQLEVDPEKTFTVRYHGRYENPEEIRNRDPGVNMDVQEDEARETVKFDPFTEEDEYPTSWAGSEKSNLTHRETNV